MCRVEEEGVGPYDWIHPCFAMLPMGWKWSLYFVQTGNLRLVEDEGGLDPLRRLNNLSGGMIIQPALGPVHYMHVDNLGILGASESTVNTALTKAARCLDAVGLTTHEEEAAATKTSMLGIDIDGEAGRAQISSRRLADRRCHHMDVGTNSVVRESFGAADRPSDLQLHAMQANAVDPVLCV